MNLLFIFKYIVIDKIRTMSTKNNIKYNKTYYQNKSSYLDNITIESRISQKVEFKVCSYIRILEDEYIRKYSYTMTSALKTYLKSSKNVYLLVMVVEKLVLKSKLIKRKKSINENLLIFVFYIMIYFMQRLFILYVCIIQLYISLQMHMFYIHSKLVSRKKCTMLNFFYQIFM